MTPFRNGALAGALAILTICANAQAPASYITNGDTYYLVTQTMGWADAEYNCVAAYNGHLASFHTLDTYNEVLSNFASTVDLTAYTMAPWIGLNDKLKEGTYVWTDGSASDFMPWRPGEPNDYSGEDCVQTMTDGFNDVNCNMALPSICLVPAPIPPGESPTPLASGGDPGDPADVDLGTFQHAINPNAVALVDVALTNGKKPDNMSPAGNLVTSILNDGQGPPYSASAASTSASQGASLVTTLFVIAGCMTLFVAAGKVAQKMRKGNQFLPITTEKQTSTSH